MAAIIEECVRTTDKVARFGGEEFVVLLREADLDATAKLAERIRGRVEENVWQHRDISIKATISVGLAIAIESDRDVQDLIERADQGLYLAKNTGRNRVFQMLGLQSKTIKAA
jgi:diguanylate cyclase (GGDEF)-like protein